MRQLISLWKLGLVIVFIIENIRSSDIGKFIISDSICGYMLIFNVFLAVAFDQESLI